jgi:hypothetical protein
MFGYHHVLLSEYASIVFTTVLPWGNYTYTRMPLGYTGAKEVPNGWVGNLVKCRQVVVGDAMGRHRCYGRQGSSRGG